MSKGTPGYILRGINDKSIAPVKIDRPEYGQHLSKSYIRAAKGNYTPKIASASEHVSYFGPQTFDALDKYVGPATIFAGASLKDSIAVLQRVDLGGSKAKLTHYIDVATKTVNISARTKFGDPIKDADPMLSSVEGIALKHIVVEEDASEASVKSGTMTNIDGSDSKMYPILSFESLDGEYYNSIGYRIKPKADSSKDLVNDNKNFMYDFELFLNQDGTLTAFKTLFQSVSTEVSLVKGTSNLTGKTTALGDRFASSYYNDTDDNLPWRDTEVTLKVNENNINVINEIVAKAEKDAQALAIVDEAGVIVDVADWFDLTGDVTGRESEVNIFDLKSSTNVPYLVCQIDDTAVSGKIVGNVNTVYNLKGGTDSKSADDYNFEKLEVLIAEVGSVNFDALAPGATAEEIAAAQALDDTAVQTVIKDYVPVTQEELEYEMEMEFIKRDLAKYNDYYSDYQEIALHPESIMYDPGYPLSVKEAMVNFISERGDTVVVLSTYITNLEGDNVIPAEDEVAIGVLLNARLSLAPESTYFGTEVCRGLICGGSCVIKDNPWTGRVPITYSLASKASAYMGASSKEWNGAKSFDAGDESAATEIMDVLPKSVRGFKDKLWTNGINWVEPLYNEKVYHFPAFSTVADDKTTLNSFFTVMACAYICKVEIFSWKTHTGESRLSTPIFLETVKKYIENELAGKFDKRFVLIPRVEITAEDAGSGTTWSQDVAVYSNNMFTVAKNSTTTFRKDILA